MAQGTGILEREKQNICTYVENNLDTFAERPPLRGRQPCALVVLEL